MTAEQVPLTLLQNQQSADQAQISAFGSVSSALSSLQTAVQALEKTSANSVFSAMGATSANTSVLTATGGTGATAGSYNITVSALASNQIVRSNAAYATTDTFNTGTLAITVGGTTTNVSIGPANNTLSGIAQAINTANAGVTETGNGATQSLTDFNYGGTDTATMVQSQAAVNAQLTLNGTPITRSSNTISDVIGGVTLNLSGTGSTSMSVAPDTSAATTAINNFVSAYNAALKAIAGVSSYDAGTNQAQPLTGNPVIQNLQSALPAIFSHSLAGIKGGMTTLADVGVSLQSDGTLSVDSAKLQATLTNPGNDVASLFGSATPGSRGFATQLDQVLNNFVSPTGAIAAQTNGLNTAIQGLTKQENQVQAYLAQVQAQYTAEFTNMDATVAQLNSVQSYMTQQLQSQLIYASQRGF
jgi:flagellar hook-associated protein 2